MANQYAFTPFFALKLKPTKFEKFGPRVRFNWGYHEARLAIADGRELRNLVETGKGDIKTVSREFDVAYYEGYRAAVVLLTAGRELSDKSTDAWRGYWATLSASEQGHVIELEAMADLAGMRNKDFTPDVWHRAIDAAASRILEH